MSAKTIVPAAVVLACFGTVVGAAEPPALPVAAAADAPVPAIVSQPLSPAAPPAAILPPVPPLPHELPPGSVRSPWMPQDAYCCGPVGANGPIANEIYTRVGVARPISGGVLNNVLDTGWALAGGGRTLFFNPEGSKAWILDVGITHVYNNGSNADEPINLFRAKNVTVRDLNRTSLDVAGGRDWFVYCPAYFPCDNARFGWNVGGRWGTSTIGLNDIDAVDEDTGRFGFSRRHDVFGSTFLGLHLDVERNWGGCRTVVGGFRVEWNYHFSDILPTEDSNMQELLMYLHFGLKF